ncbi:hypothetical protein BJY01DRAFT_200619 [Aspergillus pseudoustus]|uniref:Uncharacterized protein n=1 Tax=Aspergillus pseudoustus TaxID=1810923 RepID=A0ABR4JR99_9EURO
MTQSSLTKEVVKLARLSNLQNGLPPAMRTLPVAAIVAGGLLSKITGTSNAVEERMLGAADMIALENPSSGDSMLSPQQAANVGEEQAQPRETSNTTT